MKNQKKEKAPLQSPTSSPSNTLDLVPLKKSIDKLNEKVTRLSENLSIFAEHEYIRIHQSKWKIVLYNLILGILFAFGTVIGLVIFSWMTLNFFKDSIYLKETVHGVMSRYGVNLQEIKNRAEAEAAKHLKLPILPPIGNSVSGERLR
jgi:hypothetical protein